MAKILRLVFTCCLLVSCEFLFAHHGKGGAISYTYLGAGTTAGTSQYSVVVQHYINCDRIADEPSQIYLGIFNGATNALVTTITIAQASKTSITKKTFSACINPDPTVCYYLVIYSTTITLTDNDGGYALVEQDCCRADDIVNIANPSSTGFTNVTTIPGVINNVVYRNNSSPVLIFKDTAVICHGSPFMIDYAATDPDGDILSYSFCTAKATGSSTRQPNPPSAPPYSDVTYTSGYSGSAPLGSGAGIDAKTGLISGIAPATTGNYAITICITETRNGVPIGVTKKEVLVTVADCSLSAATLQTSYINCDNYTFTFQNETASSIITSYNWDFGVPGIATDTSSKAAPVYTYADTGTFIIKLKVANNTGCVDSTTAPVKVYPGFSPGFTVTGSCYQSPFIFKDTSKAKYGAINNWSWNFGDSASTTDTSSKQSITYTYSGPQTASVMLTVSSSKGCTGTVTKTVAVNGKPDLRLPFADTLICSNDSLGIRAISSNATSYSWTPAYNIINPNSANPIVYPKDTTTYTVIVKDQGCVDSAKVTVNVLDFITVTLPADTTVCKSDSFRLNPVSYALQYQWSPAAGLSSTTVKYPLASPAGNTVYNVVANLGKCQDKATILVRVVPYPIANAGNDTTICYGTMANLNGTINGSSFNWSPLSTLTNYTTLHPVARPLTTTNFIIAVQDTLGCPKTVRDTVLVTVTPPVKVFAGNDTSIVVGQPLQLNATTNSIIQSYNWSPVTYLNNSNIFNSVVTISSIAVSSITYAVTATTAAGCSGNDSITIKVYKTAADIFVPNAFSPNGDGNNDVFKPVAVGITSLSFFKVYNRWGELVFSTNQIGKGWDGKLNGVPQDSGTFVYMVQGSSYTGQTIFKKGTVELIR